RLNETTIRLLVAISDVDSRIPSRTPADDHARLNTTSLYTGTGVFPMLPERISNDLSSLVFNEERRVMVIEVHVSESEAPKAFGIYPALISNHAALNYSEVGDWMADQSKIPAFARVPGLLEQLHLQQRAGDILASWAAKRGLISLSGVESRRISPEATEEANLLQLNVARNMIQQFMVAANTAMAEFLEANGCPVILRAVRTPLRWDKIREIAQLRQFSLPVEPSAQSLTLFLSREKGLNPTGYPELALTVLKLLGKGEYFMQTANEPVGIFGVGVQDYTHSTAPNRRFVDLVTQRVLKACVEARPIPYGAAELREIANHCTERENAARKVERTLRKVVAAFYLRCRLGETFRGIVTGSSEKGVYVRLQHSEAEGKLVRNEQGLDVGDRIEVRLLRVDVEHGFIDFERV
ncbi:MAG: Exoribonuclease, partial [Verrucomicrobiales bacterium]|nr:Exoribonuclease [Verrucomicrobiales bacterium]